MEVDFVYLISFALIKGIVTAVAFFGTGFGVGSVIHIVNNMA